MNNLTAGLLKIIDNNIDSYIKRVADKFELDFDELKELWTGEKARPSRPPVEGGCIYEYKKGQKKNQVCGIKPKGESIYCAIHKKYENQDSKSKKILPQPKKESPSLSKKMTDRVLRKHPALKGDQLYHQPSSLVFKSATDKKVIGKIKDGKLVDLTVSDFDTVKKYGFILDEPDESSDSEEDENEKETINNHKYVKQALGMEEKSNDSDSSDSECSDSDSE